MKEKAGNVFSGQRSLFSYLTPGSLGLTPLVELPPILNPFARDKVRIFVKLTQFLPLANIKSLPSYLMLRNLRAKNVRNLVEYSSGNTVLSLTILSKHFGIPTIIIGLTVVAFGTSTPEFFIALLSALSPTPLRRRVPSLRG